MVSRGGSAGFWCGPTAPFLPCAHVAFVCRGRSLVLSLSLRAPVLWDQGPTLMTYVTLIISL